MILITGSNSLAGKTLAKKLSSHNEKIRCYDIYPAQDLPENCEFIQGDLTLENQISKICSGVKTVFHFLDVKESDHQPRDRMKLINQAGTAKLLKAARKKGVEQFIFLSSYKVYGKPSAIPLRQDDRKRPFTMYGKDKLAAEQLCWEQAKQGMPITIFRTAPIAGLEINDPTVLIILYLALAMGDSNTMYIAGDGDNRFQVIHADDAVSAFILAMKKKSDNGRIFNLGADNVKTQMEQLVHLKEEAELDVRIKHISRWKAMLFSTLLKPFKINYLNPDHLFFLLNSMLLDTQMAKNELGWQPKKDNTQTLLETILWYKNKML